MSRIVISLARAQAGDHVQQLVADARVEADGRLVEEEHARLGDQRAGDLQAPALAAAVGPDRAIDERRQAERLHEVGDPRVGPGRAGRPTGARAARGSRRPGERHDRRPPPGRRRCSRARAASAWRATSKPARRAVPAVGATVVVSIPTVVDLPAPLGPSRPNTSPGATSKSQGFHGRDAARVRLGQAVDFDRVHGVSWVCAGGAVTSAAVGSSLL